MRAGVGEIFAEEAEVSEAGVRRGEGFPPVDAAKGDMAGDIRQQGTIPRGIYKAMREEGRVSQKIAQFRLTHLCRKRSPRLVR